MKQTTTGLAILMAAGLALGGCASNSEKQEMDGELLLEEIISGRGLISFWPKTGLSKL